MASATGPSSDPRSRAKANIWLTVGIREGKNREVRKVLEKLGLKVNRLIRIAFGPFDLGELEDGAVKEVETAELRAKLGEQIVAASGADFEAPVPPKSLPCAAILRRVIGHHRRGLNDRAAGPFPFNARQGHQNQGPRPRAGD